jgi:wyosine [tRNA(Phe)-imidazoG37] synthetase (radical SAM superfamily)
MQRSDPPVDPRTHLREADGLRYAYAVISRRSRGISLGVNLNWNNACNWRCVYCQVPGLVLGKAPPVELGRLRADFEGLLDAVLSGAWQASRVPPVHGELMDVAFSGNGEPTSSPHFPEAVELVGAALQARNLVGRVPLVLITNGSLVHQPRVEAAIRRLSDFGGEVWFKLDSATDAGIARMNSAHSGAARQLDNLRRCARACRTFVQSIALVRAGVKPDEAELRALQDALRTLHAEGVPLAGVLLYGYARASHQPEASELAALPEADLRALGARLAEAGYEVRVHP